MNRTRWYKDALIYQIYPRSFFDSNNDGIGDIQGIITKLDYIQSLGVDAIWLCPVYDSPNDDNGYDIRNYRDIAADFGNLDDWKSLKNEMKQRGMRLIMDFVGNHTSDEHPWFQEALHNSTSQYRNYYFFRLGKDASPPNNWTGFFGEGAWQKIGTSNEYYLRLFTRKQPDVNWDNPLVRNEFKGILKFWIDLGVDGFRCDVITIISKKSGLPNGKKRLGLTGREHFINGPHVHDYLRELYREVLEPNDIMTVGESVMMTIDEAPQYVNEHRKELDMLFTFEHMDVDNWGGIKWLMRPFSLVRFKKVMEKWQKCMMEHQGWNSLYWENHDQPRSVGRFHTSSVNFRVESAKMLAVAMYFHQGTPYIYQGQELGMTNAPFNTLDQYRDTETHSIYHLSRRLHIPKWYIMRAIRRKSRDHARTPMQWNSTPYAGFSTVEPWIPVNPNYQEINVEAQELDTNSVLHFYRKMFQLRKSLEVVKLGDYCLHFRSHRKIYMYSRNSKDDSLLIVANFSSSMIPFSFPKELDSSKYHLQLSTYSSCDEALTLAPFEARVYQMNK